jgi:hypothetical protein
MIRDYVAIARPDNWFKNVFMLPGVFLGILAAPPRQRVRDVGQSCGRPGFHVPGLFKQLHDQ